MATANLGLSLIANSGITFGDWITTFQADHDANMAILDAVCNSASIGLMAVANKTANYTLSSTADCFVVASTTGAGVNFGINGAAVSTGKTFVIINSGAATVTATGGGQTINGNTLLTIGPSTGSRIIKNASTTFVAY